MKNITFFKIGLDLYENCEDKNSGLYEYNLIKSELEIIDMYVPFGTLVILNGKPNDTDKLMVESMIEACHKVGSKAIYIVSDSVAFNNIDLTNKFDVVLHQAWKYDFAKIQCKQHYSYVPELFYLDRQEELDRPYNNLVLFCGNNTGRIDKINEYVRGQKGTKKNMFSLIKGDDKDERIPHDIYLRLQSMFKYSLMICREQYRDCGWITARLIEAIDAGSLPFFDEDYDKNEAYFIASLKVCNKYDLNNLVKFYNKHDDVRISLLQELQTTVQKRRIKFADTILKYANEKE